MAVEDTIRDMGPVVQNTVGTLAMAETLIHNKAIELAKANQPAGHAGILDLSVLEQAAHRDALKDYARQVYDITDAECPIHGIIDGAAGGADNNGLLVEMFTNAVYEHRTQVMQGIGTPDFFGTSWLSLTSEIGQSYTRAANRMASQRVFNAHSTDELRDWVVDKGGYMDTTATPPTLRPEFSETYLRDPQRLQNAVLYDLVGQPQSQIDTLFKKPI